MAKYYNAETLLEFVKQNTPNFNSETTMQCVERAIKEAPTADVVEVVRCEECEHSREIDRSNSPEKYFNSHCVVCECEKVVGDEPMIYPKTHFCSYGERK